MGLPGCLHSLPDALKAHVLYNWSKIRRRCKKSDGLTHADELIQFTKCGIEIAKVHLRTGDLQEGVGCIIEQRLQNIRARQV